MKRQLGEIIGYGDNGLPAFNTKNIDEYRAQGLIDVVSIHEEGSEIDIYGLSDGTFIDKRMAVELTNNGLLNGCIVSTSKLGEKYVKESPDRTDENNLRRLPKLI